MNLTVPWAGAFNRTATTELIGLPLSNPLRNGFTEKRWCYAGLVSPGLFFGAAVIHLGYVTSAFCFAFDRETREMTETALTLPPLGHCRYDRNPDDGTCRFRGLGSRIEINNLGTTQKALSIDLKSGLRAEILFSAPGTGLSPMHFPMDMGEGRRAFTTKAAGFCATGEVAVKGRAFSLDPAESFGLFDWTHGAYPRQTFWNWACGAGRATDDQGKDTLLGFNFSRGVYENGRLENTLWIDGQPESIPEITWEYNAKDPMTPWKIFSKGQAPVVDLAFNPEGIRSANDNFLLVKSRFLQPCGRFDGHITTCSGRVLTLGRVSGVVEEHFAKW